MTSLEHAIMNTPKIENIKRIDLPDNNTFKKLKLENIPYIFVNKHKPFNNFNDMIHLPFNPLVKIRPTKRELSLEILEKIRFKDYLKKKEGYIGNHILTTNDFNYLNCFFFL